MDGSNVGLNFLPMTISHILQVISSAFFIDIGCLSAIDVIPNHASIKEIKSMHYSRLRHVPTVLMGDTEPLYKPEF